jgi:hypothetical protein
MFSPPLLLEPLFLTDVNTPLVVFSWTIFSLEVGRPEANLLDGLIDGFLGPTGLEHSVMMERLPQAELTRWSLFLWEHLVASFETNLWTLLFC